MCIAKHVYYHCCGDKAIDGVTARILISSLFIFSTGVIIEHVKKPTDFEWKDIIISVVYVLSNMISTVAIISFVMITTCQNILASVQSLIALSFGL